MLIDNPYAAANRIFELRNGARHNLWPRKFDAWFGLRRHQFVYDDATTRLEIKALKGQPNLGFGGKNGCSLDTFLTVCFRHECVSVFRLRATKIRLGDKSLLEGAAMKSNEPNSDLFAKIVLEAALQPDVVYSAYVNELFARHLAGYPCDAKSMLQHFRGLGAKMSLEKIKRMEAMFISRVHGKPAS